MNQNFPVVFPYNFSASFSRPTGNTRVYCERNWARDHIVFRRICTRIPRPRWCTAFLHSPPPLHAQPPSRLMYFCSSRKIEIPPANIPYNVIHTLSYYTYNSVFTHRSFAVVVASPSSIYRQARHVGIHPSGGGLYFMLHKEGGEWK